MSLASEYKIISENDIASATFEIFPVSEGHCFVISKRHFSSFFDIYKEEYQVIFDLIVKMKNILDNRFSPDGNNI